MTKDRVPLHHGHHEFVLSPSDLAHVTDLLTQSKAAHIQYQQEQRLPSPNYGRAETSVAQALDLRLQADALDPAHETPVWEADEFRWPHDALLAFYRHYPFIP